MTIEQVRKDLREIRYYYSRKKELDYALDTVENSAIQSLLEKYNKVMKLAGIRLYSVYVDLYINNMTQSGMAASENLCLGYVKQLHRNLLDFLVENL